MRTIQNITIKDSAGEDVKVNNGKESKKGSASVLILTLLDNVKYKSRIDQRQADKIYAKIENVTESDTQISLEDAEFDLVYAYCQDYEPFLSGRMFVPFFDELDRAKNEGDK